MALTDQAVKHYRGILDSIHDPTEKEEVLAGIRSAHSAENSHIVGSKDDLRSMGQKTLGRVPEDPNAVQNRGDFIPGVLRGIDTTKAMLYGGTALAGRGMKAIGLDSAGQAAMDFGLQGYRRNMAEAEKNPAKYSFKDVYTGDAGIGGAIDWAQGTIGELVPTMAEAAAGAFIGSMVAPGAGTAAGAFAGRTVLKKSIDKLTKEAVKAQVKKGVLKEAIKKGMTKEAAEAALESQIKKSVTSQALKALGGKVGMGAAVLPMEAGGMYAGLLEEHGVDAPGTAMLFGAASTAMEYAGGNSKLIDAFMGAVSKGSGGMIKKTAKELLKNIPEEAAQEAGQELMQVLHTVVNTDERLLTADNLEQIVEAAGAGAVGGGAGAVTSGLLSRRKPQEVKPPAKASDSEKVLMGEEVGKSPEDVLFDGDETTAEENYWKAQEQELLNQRGAQDFKTGLQSQGDMPTTDRRGNPVYSDTVPLQEVQPAKVQGPDNARQARETRQREIEGIYSEPDRAANDGQAQQDKNIAAFRRLRSIEKSLAALEQRQRDIKYPDDKKFQAGLKDRPDESQMPLPADMPAFQRGMAARREDEKYRPFAGLDKEMRRGLPEAGQDRPDYYDDGIEVSPNATFDPTFNVDDYRFQKAMAENVNAQDLPAKVQDFRARVSDLKKKKNLSKKNQSILANLEKEIEALSQSPMMDGAPFNVLSDKDMKDLDKQQSQERFDQGIKTQGPETDMHGRPRYADVNPFAPGQEMSAPGQFFGKTESVQAPAESNLTEQAHDKANEPTTEQSSAVEKESFTTADKPHAEFKKGVSVSWTDKKGETVRGQIIKKQGNGEIWQVKKENGRTTRVHAKHMTIENIPESGDLQKDLQKNNAPETLENKDLQKEKVETSTFEIPADTLKKAQAAAKKADAIRLVWQHPDHGHWIVSGKGPGESFQGKIYSVMPDGSVDVWREQIAKNERQTDLTGKNEGQGLDVKEYPGTKGDKTHLTRSETGLISVSKISHLPGESGEVRGEHRNRTGKDWDDFKRDISENGIKSPILILKDPGKKAVIREGNHRLDAAIELGLKEIPVEIRYFGQSEKEGLVYDPVKQPNKAEPSDGYEDRLKDRYARIENAKNDDEVDAITKENAEDDERHFDGTIRLEAAGRQKKEDFVRERARQRAKERYEAGEWVFFDRADSTSHKGANQEAKDLNKEDPAHEYRGSYAQNDMGSYMAIERRLRKGVVKQQSNKAEPQDYKARLKDRLSRVEKAQTVEDIDAVIKENIEDNEHTYPGIVDLESAGKKRKEEIKQQSNKAKIKDLKEAVRTQFHADWKENIFKVRHAANVIHKAGFSTPEMNAAHTKGDEKALTDAVQVVLDKYGIEAPDYKEEKQQDTKETTGQESKQTNKYGAGNKIFTADAAEKARETLRKKLSGNQLNSGIDPEILLAGIQLGGYHIEAGARTFAAYSKAMIQDVGDSIKPFLRSFYEGVRHYPGFNTKGMDPMPTQDLIIDEKYADILQSEETIEGPELLDGIEAGTLTPDELDTYLNKSDNLDADKAAATSAIANRIGDLKETYRYESQKEGQALEEYLDSLLAVVQKNRVPENQLSDTSPGTKDRGQGDIPDNTGINKELSDGKGSDIEPASKNEAGADTNKQPEPGAGLGSAPILSDREQAGMDETNVLPAAQELEGRADEGNADGGIEQGDTQGQGGTVPGPDRGNNPQSDNRTAGRPGRSARRDAGRNTEPDSGVEPKPSRTNEIKPEDQNHVIEKDDVIFPGGAETKIQTNAKAISLLKKLESEDRNPTPDEKKLLAQYVGWGAFAQKVFNNDFSNAIRNEDFIFGTMKEKYETWKKKYGSKFHPDLGGILTKEEWDSARESTKNAHYTSKEVAQSVWALIDHLGFQGGQVLEPSAGVGHFFGLMPQDIAKNSSLNGVELDSISGRILSKLYPQARIQNTGFEKATGLKRNSMDLVVSNFPFGDYSVHDPKFKDYKKWSIHNYFFGKSIDLAKPGGLVVGITSHYTLDAVGNGAIRKTISEKADLIGAIRLPDTAFKKDAGTDVVTDILVFRKKDGTEQLGNRFRVTDEIKIGEAMTPINEYFTQNPDMILGTNSMEGSMYGGNQYTVKAKPGNIEDQILEAIKRLPADIAGEVDQANIETTVYANSDAKEGTLALKDDKVMLVENGVLVTPKVVNSKGQVVKAFGSPAKLGRAKSYVVLRDKTFAAIEAMQDPNKTDAEVEQIRQDLASTYQAFVKKYNRLNSVGNSILRKVDNDFPIVDALENETITVSPTGKQVKEYSDADLLSKRTIFPFKEPTQADTIEDAIPISLVYRNKIDTAYVAKLTGMDEAAVRDQILKNENAYIDPKTGLIETPDKYLSGNVKKKLIQAQEQAKADPQFERNVKALEAAQPDYIDLDFVFFKLGSSWVPDDAVTEFARHLTDVNVSYSQIRTKDNNSWAMAKGRNYSNTAKNRNTWGVPGADAISLIQDSLNLRRTKVFRDEYDPTTGKMKRVQDKEASLVAQKKQDEIQDAFRGWAKSHREWAPKLSDIYNEEHNGFRSRQFPTPNIKRFPGMNPDITLRPLQVKAVSRALQESTLLSYGVGTGKTFTYVSLAMEMRRLKTAQKPMIVVQNSTIQQFAKAFKFLYPQSKVLIPNDQQRSAKNRKKLLAQVSTGDWDAVVIPHSFFDRIADDPQREAALIREQIEELEAAIEAAAEREGKNAPTVKQMETAKANKQARVQALLDRETDDTITFEKMGVDALLIDEAHAYKRSEFSTKMGNIKGIDSGASQRSASLMLKSDFIREKTNNKNIILATGTPISNTTAELWTMMRYVKPELLEEYGVSIFDDFAANFGDTTVTTEETETGDFKEVERFNKFANGPELLTLFHMASDVVLTKDANLNLPKVVGGQAESVVVERSEELGEYIEYLRQERQRFENMTGREKMENRHIPLLIYGRAQKASIDMRMIDPKRYKDDPNSKLSTVSNSVFDLYKQHPGKTQVIFLDKYQDATRTFNAYHDIRDKLIAKGMPKDEILIISDANNDSQKEAMFQRMRTGEASVIIGSTSKLGVGVNMQDKLIAAHHVDVPPRPMDIEQRNGRIVREGNENPDVFVKNYGVKNTLDSVMYDRLIKKQKFIDQMLSGKIQGREFDDPLGEEQISFAEMNAAFAGNPLLFEKNDVAIKLKELEILEQAHIVRVSDAKRTIRGNVHSIEWLEEALVEADQKAEMVNRDFAEGAPREFEFNGQEMSQKDFIKAFNKSLQAQEERIRNTFEGKTFKEADNILANGTAETTFRGKLNGYNMAINVKPFYMIVHRISNFVDKKGESNKQTGRLRIPENAQLLDINTSLTRDRKLLADWTGDQFIRSLNRNIEMIQQKPGSIRQRIQELEADNKNLKKVTETTFERSDELVSQRERLAEINRELEAGPATQANTTKAGKPDIGAAGFTQQKLNLPGRAESLFSTTQDKPPGQGLNIKDIQNHFKGQKVSVAQDGTVSVRFQNGKGVTVKIVEQIGGEYIKLAIASGRMGKDGIILGKYQDQTITLNKALADTETLTHETLHMLKDLGILTPQEIRGLDTYRAKLVKEGKYRYQVLENAEENQANTLAQIIADRAAYRNNGALSRIIQKVMDFWRGLVKIATGITNAQSLAKEMESGDIYSRPIKEVEQNISTDMLPVFHSEKNATYKVRTGPAPKKTVKAYKAFRYVDGKLYPMFVGSSGKGEKKVIPLAINQWMDALDGGFHFTGSNGRQYVPTFNGRGGASQNIETTPMAQKKKLVELGYIKSVNSKNVTAVAYRPGWHAGNLPYFPQGGIKDKAAPHGMRHEPNTVIAEVAMNADTDLKQEFLDTAEYSKAGAVKPLMSGIRRIPNDGYYEYSTNPKFYSEGYSKDKWFISGSLKINRIIPAQEVDAILKENDVEPQLWAQGGPMFQTSGNIDSPEFKAWFGKSVAKTKDGEPVTFYHGTPNTFTVFEDRAGESTQHLTAGLGHFFSMDKDYAKAYSKDSGNVMEVYLKMEKPYRMSLEEAQSFETMTDATVKKRLLKLKKYDSVIIPIPGANPYIIVFNPEQIKSVANRGTWDSNNPDIRFSTSADAVPAQEKEKAFSQIYAGMKNILANRKDKGPGYKPDISVIENTLGLMSHYSEKIPALKRTFDELLKRPEYKFIKTNELSKNGEESLMGVMSDLQKQDKAAYKALNDYLVDRDINQVGTVIFQDEDGTWTVKSELDEFGKRSVLEEGLWSKKHAREAAIAWEVDEYPDAKGRDALKAFRTMTAKLHDFYAQSWQEIIKDHEARGLTLPQVVSRTQSGEVRIDLKAALAKMGERSSYYFPRQRSNGDWQVYAKKDGEHDFIEYRDFKQGADFLAGKMKAKGYDVQVKKVGSMSEDVYQGIKNILSTQAMVNQALAETKMDVKMRTLKDLGLRGEWRGQDYVIPNGGVYEWSSSVLDQLGGQEYSDLGKRGNSWSPGYRFKDAPADIESVVVNALYSSRGQETDVAFEIGRSLVNQLADTLRARGSRARMISRSDAIGQDVPVGYETDALKAIAQAVNSAAGGYAKQQVAINTSKAITGQHYSWQEWQGQHSEYDNIVAAEQALFDLRNNTETEEERIKDIDKEIKQLQRERAGVQTESEKARQDRLYRIGNLFREKEKIRRWKDKAQAGALHREIARARGKIHEDYRNYIQDNMIDPKKQKRAYTDAVNAVENVLKNDEAGDRVINTLKGLASVWFLGGRLSSAAINLTAMGTTVPAAMDAYGNIPLHKTAQHIAQAGKSYMSFVTGKGKVAKEDRAILEEIFSRGWVAAQLNMETVNALKSGPARGYSRAVELMMTPFKVTEEFNRGTTILAAYKGIMAQNPKMGKDAALQKAKTVSDRAHGIYGVENQPALLRKGRGLRAASALYIFQTFMHNYFTTMAYMIGRKQAAAATYMILSPMIFGGAASSVLVPAVKMIFKAIGEDDPEEKIYDVAENLFGETGDNVARYGLPGLAGVSLKGSLAPNLPDFKEPLDALGPIGGMMRNVYEGGVNLTRGDYLKGVEKITPLALGNVAKAYREASQGVTTRAGDPVFFGNEQIKGDVGTGLLRAAGINPTKIAKPMEIQWHETVLKQQYADRKRKIYNRIIHYHAQPAAKKDPIEWQEIVMDIREFNGRIRSNGLVNVVPYITSRTIKNRIRLAFRPSKREKSRAKEEA